MASEKTVLRQSQEVNIAQCIIESNTGGDQKDIVDLITDIYYYESILEPSIRTNIIYVDTGKTIQKGQTTQTLIEGLPLQGTESVKIKITDGNDIKLEFEQFVTQIVPVGQDTTKSVVTLDLVSEEGIINYKASVNQRFDGKVSEHVKKILTDKKYLGTEKKLDIESTENTYNFIGNQKRPFYSILWLAKKSIPSLQGAKQNTAGYFFYETSEGFKFKSIDSLLSQEKKKSFIYNQTPDSAGENLPSGYSAKILEHSVDDVSGDIQSKLQMGTYSTRTILFDPFNCYYEVITKEAEKTELITHIHFDAKYKVKDFYKLISTSEEEELNLEEEAELLKDEIEEVKSGTFKNEDLLKTDWTALQTEYVDTIKERNDFNKLYELKSLTQIKLYLNIVKDKYKYESDNIIVHGNEKICKYINSLTECINALCNLV